MQTNDPEQPFLQLVVTGRVEKFADIRPAQVRLEGQVGAPLTVEVEILPNKDYPFTILEVRPRRDDLIRCELVEQCDAGRNRCVLRIENLKATSGRYAETITVRTDNAERPSFAIPVMGWLH